MGSHNIACCGIVRPTVVREVSAAEIYDQIGSDYAAHRKPDPRWVARIHRRLEGHHTLVNVGAGTGSYEPAFMSVVGIEPSHIMIRQRAPSAAPAICGVAEHLPFKDRTFDVALAVLTVHHWADPEAGLAEMRRVSRKQLVVTWDPDVFARQFWFVRDYLPEAAARETPSYSCGSVGTSRTGHYRGTDGTGQLHGWLFRGLLAAAGRVSRCDRSGRHLRARSARQRSRCGRGGAVEG